MHDVVLIEDGCCHAGELDDLVAFLERRFEGRATITKYGVGGRLGFSAVPVELGERLLAQGGRSLPVLAVDGHLLLQGEMPDHEAIAESIEARAVPAKSQAGATAA